MPALPLSPPFHPQSLKSILARCKLGVRLASLFVSVLGASSYTTFPAMEAF